MPQRTITTSGGGPWQDTPQDVMRRQAAALNAQSQQQQAAMAAQQRMAQQEFMARFLAEQAASMAQAQRDTKRMGFEADQAGLERASRERADLFQRNMAEQGRRDQEAYRQQALAQADRFHTENLKLGILGPLMNRATEGAIRGGPGVTFGGGEQNVPVPAAAGGTPEAPVVDDEPEVGRPGFSQNNAYGDLGSPVISTARGRAPTRRELEATDAQRLGALEFMKKHFESGRFSPESENNALAEYFQLSKADPAQAALISAMVEDLALDTRVKAANKRNWLARAIRGLSAGEKTAGGGILRSGENATLGESFDRNYAAREARRNQFPDELHPVDDTVDWFNEALGIVGGGQTEALAALERIRARMVPPPDPPAAEFQAPLDLTTAAEKAYAFATGGVLSPAPKTAPKDVTPPGATDAQGLPAGDEAEAYGPARPGPADHPAEVLLREIYGARGFGGGGGAQDAFWAEDRANPATKGDPGGTAARVARRIREELMQGATRKVVAPGPRKGAFPPAGGVAPVTEGRVRVSRPPMSDQGMARLREQEQARQRARKQNVPAPPVPAGWASGLSNQELLMEPTEPESVLQEFLRVTRARQQEEMSQQAMNRATADQIVGEWPSADSWMQDLIRGMAPKVRRGEFPPVPYSDMSGPWQPEIPMSVLRRLMDEAMRRAR